MRVVRRIAAACALFLLASCGGGGGTGSAPAAQPPLTDTTPDNFSFAARSNVAAGIPVESDAVTITGINAAAAIAISGGEYSINNGVYTAAGGRVTNGQRVSVRLTSSATPGASTTATLTVGGVSAVFRVSTLAAAAGGPQPIGSQNWSMFGYDYSNTRASKDQTIDAQNIPMLRVAQRVTGAGVSSTPAVVDGIVYYSDFAGWLKAVDAVTGIEVWSTRLQTTMLTPSPFVSGDSVYIAGDNSNVYAVNRTTGAVRWAVAIETTPFNRIWSSPMVVGDTLLIGAGTYQVFFAATPMFRGSVVALNARTGAEKWRFSVCPSFQCGGGVSVWSSVAVDPALKLAYIGTGQAYAAPAGPYSDAIAALNYETGALVWHQQITPNDIYTISGGSLVAM